MKKLFIPLLVLISFFAGYFLKNFTDKRPEMEIVEKVLPKEKPLERYAIENLSETGIKAGKLEIKNPISETRDYKSYLFEFQFNPNLDGKTIKKVSGQINFPFDDSKPRNPKGVILMLRGYVDQELYQTGDGTRRAAEYFSEAGFITIAPDFLGYGKSEKEADNIFESRFQTYVTTISFLRTLESLFNHSELTAGASNLTSILTTNKLPIFIWSHSNGGQIALTTLEITGVIYPTTLWAPVSKAFPYSILYYTDEAEDRGKLIRSELSKFEEDYDVDKYSLDLYFDKIKAPLQIQQGTNDDAVSVEWSNGLVRKLQEQGVEVVYKIYSGADHNMRPFWDEAVESNLVFFNSFLKD